MTRWPRALLAVPLLFASLGSAAALAGAAPRPERSHTVAAAAALQIPGIVTQINGYGLQNAMPLLSFDISAVQSGGKPALAPLQIVKHVDIASPYLAAAYRSGKTFAGTTELVVLIGTQQPSRFTILLSNVSVIADRQTGTSNGVIETVSLAYTGIETCYTGATCVRP